jgi:hypothetical protein
MAGDQGLDTTSPGGDAQGGDGFPPLEASPRGGQAEGDKEQDASQAQQEPGQQEGGQMTYAAALMGGEGAVTAREETSMDEEIAMSQSEVSIALQSPVGLWAKPSTHSGGSKTQIMFVASAPEGMARLVGMRVTFAVGSSYGSAPQARDYRVAEMGLLSEPGKIYASSWLPVHPPTSRYQRAVVYYAYEVLVRGQVHRGSWPYTEARNRRRVELAPDQCLRRFDLQPRGPWDFAGPYTIGSRVEGMARPVAEQLTGLSLQLAMASDRIMWGNAARHLRTTLPEWTGSRLDVRRAAVAAVVRLVEGLGASPEPLAQATLLLMAGFARPSGAPEAQAHAGELPSSAAFAVLTEAAMTHVSTQHAEPRNTVMEGVRLLVEHSVLFDGDYAWLPVLLWREIDVSGHVSRLLCMGQRGAQGGGARIFLERATDILVQLVSSLRWASTMSALLGAAPTAAAQEELLVRAFEVPGAPEASHETILRPFTLSRLLGLVAREGRPLPASLSATIRRAVVERARSEVLPPKELGRAVGVLALRGDEVKPIIRAMQAGPEAHTPAFLAAVLASTVSDLFHPDDPFLVQACRLWYESRLERQRGGGELPPVQATRVLREGLIVGARADGHLKQALLTVAAERLRHLAHDERGCLRAVPQLDALLSSPPYAAPVTMEEVDVEVEDFVWENSLSQAVEGRATSREPEGLAEALRALHVTEGERAGMVPGRLAVRALKELMRGFGAHVLGRCEDSKPPPSVLIEYVDFWAPSLCLEGHVEVQRHPIFQIIAHEAADLVGRLYFGTIAIGAVQGIIRCAG